MSLFAIRKGVALFDRLFGAPNPAPPVFLRVRASSGKVPETVSLELTWASGLRESKAVMAAQGLCMLPWRESERGVQIVVHALGGSGQLRVAARENKRSAARDVFVDTELATK